MGRFGLALGLVSLSAFSGCAHAPAIGRGGRIYAVAVDSVNGRRTADNGSIYFPAISIQVGDRFARVWLADQSRGDVTSPVVLEGDAEALKAGILVERTWNEAVVHKVTDEELAVGVAVVYVPGTPHPTVVELRFDQVSKPLAGRPIRRKPGWGGSIDRQDNLSKDLARV